MDVKLNYAAQLSSPVAQECALHKFSMQITFCWVLMRARLLRNLLWTLSQFAREAVKSEENVKLVQVTHLHIIYIPCGDRPCIVS